ncbi:unnamed protein product, partial [Ectocarpus fasciculatus]
MPHFLCFRVFSTFRARSCSREWLRLSQLPMRRGSELLEVTADRCLLFRPSYPIVSTRRHHQQTVVARRARPWIATSVCSEQTCLFPRSSLRRGQTAKEVSADL